MLCGKLNQDDEAIIWLEKAKDHKTITSIADTALKNNDIDLAIKAYSAALKFSSNSDLKNNYGVALLKLRRLENASNMFLSAYNDKPDNDAYFNNYIFSLIELAQFSKVVFEIEKRFINNTIPFYYYEILISMKRYIFHYISAKRDTEYLFEHRNSPIDAQYLASIKDYLCDWDQVKELSDLALAGESDNDTLWEMRLYTLSYHPYLSDKEIFSEFRNWGVYYSKKYENRYTFNSINKHSRIKLGFVSPDFRKHSSHQYFMPFFKNIDRSLFELFAYSNVPWEDSITAEYKTVFDQWRNIKNLNSNDAADLIYNDRIDILVDTCNHMLGSRLDIFALKPAPIQCTWLGSAWTSGLNSIDYVIFDKHTAPTSSLCTENIVKLPNSFVTFQPMHPEYIPTNPPCFKNGYVTFGYTGRSERLNDRVFCAWAKLLSDMPNARLILDFGCFGVPENQVFYKTILQKSGIDLNRCILKHSAEVKYALEEIDILLDSFPHSGGTMLFDAIWMGVPFVTLSERAPLGRIGTSININLGHAELIATSEQQYVQIAKRLGSDFEAIKLMRSTLRSKFFSSPLNNAELFANDMQYAFTEMLRRHANNEGLSELIIPEHNTRRTVR